MTIPNPTSIRIAVLDDDPMILKVFRALMQKSYYKADFYADSSELFHKISQDPSYYQLLVTDIQMPGIDGVSFAKKLRQLRPDLPVIFMTATPYEHFKAEALAMGRTLFLEKPFPVEEILRDFLPKMMANEI